MRYTVSVLTKIYSLGNMNISSQPLTTKVLIGGNIYLIVALEEGGHQIQEESSSGDNKHPYYIFTVCCCPATKQRVEGLNTDK